MKKTSLIIFALLTGCSVWDTEFEGDVVRAYPNASIHQISTMMDNGLIQEESDDIVIDSKSVKKLKVFKDGEVSRGVDDVRRIYMTTYEDSSHNLHFAHHLYFVVRPATWMVK